MFTIRTCIADDEALSRQKLRHLLQDEADIDIVGESASGNSTIELVQQLQPDLLFLDIHMPELDGFQVIGQLAGSGNTLVIIISAHGQYALEAFEAQVQDYLLKPFDRQRLGRSLEMVRERLQLLRNPFLSQSLEQLVREKQSNRYARRLMIKSKEDILFIKTEDVDWIEAAGNYVSVHSGNKSHLLRDTMSNLEKKLDPERFIRIHRSQIVNIERIKKLQSWSHGEYLIIMSDNTELLLTRTYKDNLMGMFETS